MSRIEAVKVNYQRNSNLNQGQTKKFAQQPAFGEKFILPDEALKIIKKGVETKIDERTGKMGSFFTWLADGKGEIQTQSITAIFTSTLAPLMIWKNPFSNEDNKTKAYTALRQPISATIAITGGLAMTIGINKYMDKIYNEGLNESIDLRISPSKEYLKGSFNKRYKEAKSNNKLEDFLNKYCPDIEGATKKELISKGKLTNKVKRICLKNYVKGVNDERIEVFSKLISEEDPKNIKVNKNGIIEINGKEIEVKDGKGTKLFKDKIPNLQTQAELDEYLKKNNLNSRTFADFMKNEFKVEFHEDGSLKLYSMEKKLSEIKALDFLEQLGLFEKDKINETELHRALMALRQKNKTIEKVGDEFSSGVLKNNNAGKLVEALGQDETRNGQLLVGEVNGKSRTITLGQMFHHLGIRGEKLQELMNDNMGKVLKDFSMEHLKELKIDDGKDANGKTILKNLYTKFELTTFSTNILKRMAKTLTTNAGNHKFWIGILTNLVTTAITCTILNWAYPRIVEKVAPSLLKKDNKGGN